MKRDNPRKNGKSSPFCFAVWLLGLATILIVPHLASAQDDRNAVDTPAEGGIVTGNTVLSGWHCRGQELGIQAQFDNDPGTRNPVALTNRRDIPCDNKDNGFVVQFLWPLLTAGSHSVQFFLGDAGVSFASRNVSVVRIKSDAAFLVETSGGCTGTIRGPDGFRTDFRAEWQQGLQNVSIVKTGADVCPDDMVAAGPLCVDRYEASVFNNLAGTGTQLGDGQDNYPCSDNGNGCRGQIFALSQAGVRPSGSITWFQAQQACTNVGKRLLTNAEWQTAAAGTPDPGVTPAADECNTGDVGLDLTGIRTNCISDWGAYDMVGNAAEWVADWMQGVGPNVIDDNTATYGTDMVNGVNEIGPSNEAFPPAILRGGAVSDGDEAGVFAFRATFAPSESPSTFGFRCGRHK